MKNYNYQEFMEPIHTIQITLQVGEYKGHIAYEVGGNCCGYSLLDNFTENHIQEDIDMYVLNDCQLRYDDEYFWWHMVLKDKDGNECEVECHEADLENYIVAVEIIGVKEGEYRE